MYIELRCRHGCHGCIVRRQLPGLISVTDLDVYWTFTVTCSLDIVTARAFVTVCLTSVFEMTVYLLTYV